MSELPWREHVLATPDGPLAWYEAGDGPTVVWINGGPGDDHRYLRPVAAPFTARLRCVLYDQRGCGRSRLGRLDAETLDVERFVADLEALRAALGEERLRLVGHSWGATLALLYAAAHPERTERAALVGMGPMDDEMDAVAAANLLKPLSAAERIRRAELAVERDRALDAGDAARVRAVDLEIQRLNARAWFATPAAAERFLEAWAAEAPPNRLVNRLAYQSYRRLRAGVRVELITAPVLVVYGYQDFLPVVQAYRLRERVPQTRIVLLNECGHEPWLEQPARFQDALLDFLLEEPRPA